MYVSSWSYIFLEFHCNACSLIFVLDGLVLLFRLRIEGNVFLVDLMDGILCAG